MKIVHGFFALWMAAAVALEAQDVSLTVYNQDLALVREIRTMTLKAGVSTVSFTGVSERIDPTSVHFQSLTTPKKAVILEQNFEYDLVNAGKILEKYVDQDVRLVTEKGELFEGTLLSASGGDIVIQTREGKVQIIRPEKVQNFDFPKLPDGLITRPTLVWLVKNDGPEIHKTEIRYLTEGINWHAEYVAITDSLDKNLDLSGWVSIDNRSGATYPNATLKLVAGDIHRVEPPVPLTTYRADMAMAKAEAAPQFEEESFFEYHLYTLLRSATIKNNQIKQLSLFPSVRTKSQKIFLFDGAQSDKKVRVYVEFRNSTKEGLGLPLPKGKIRVYKQDRGGALEFVGEDQLDHTPVDEKVRILLGNAFDCVGERISKAVRKLSDRSREEEIVVSLRNHKETAVDMVVVEHLWGDWKITKSSHEYKTKDSRTVEWSVPVPARGETMVSFTVLTRW